MAARNLSAAAPRAIGVLSGPRRFAAVRSFGVRRTVGVVRVAAAPNPRGETRLGMSISGVRPAVLRNRLRRRLRAALRSPLQSHVGLDVVVMAGPAAAMAPYSILASEVGAAVAAAAAAVTARMMKAPS